MFYLSPSVASTQQEQMAEDYVNKLKINIDNSKKSRTIRDNKISCRKSYLKLKKICRGRQIGD